MTKAEMKVCIETAANYERNAGSTVDINQALPYVAVTIKDSDTYFFQGDEADELIAEHERAAAKFDVTLQDSILHSAQGW